MLIRLSCQVLNDLWESLRVRKAIVQRAEILNSGEKYLVGARITINAPAEQIFNFIANPHNHAKIDGSKMVKGRMVGPERLVLGSRFFMRMQMGLPYIMRNRVVEFKENELLGWKPLARNIWRYELKQLADGSTEVTQWMDGRNAPKILMKREITWADKAIAKTLVNLKQIIEANS